MSTTDGLDTLARRGAAARSPLPLEVFEASATGFADAISLPPAVYTDPDFYDFEIDAVFRREWLCVGRVDQVAEVGDFFTVNLMGEPLIVVRDRDRTVRVMSSVCQHRGMCVTAPPQRPPEEWFEPVPETKGNRKRFKCPYHWWTYDLDGRLVAAPEMARTNNFSKADIRLPQLKVEVWKGFVFVNFDPDAAPLAPRLTALDAVLEPYGFEEMVTVEPQRVPGLPFNWKIMVENFMEGYHPDRLHHGIHDFAPSSRVYYAPYTEGDGAIHGGIRTAEPDGGFNPMAKAIFPIIEGLTDEQRRTQLFLFVPPSLLIGVQPDSAFWFTVQPRRPDSHDLSMAYLFPRETTELPVFEELLDVAVRGVELFNNQDLPANTAIQHGMASQFAPRGRYSWQEEVLAHFNKWLLERYRRAEQDASAAR
jgi:phenylpropionate dioxygenase-like ring-hydroxylating dioxygenase large terminal subunit